MPRLSSLPRSGGTGGNRVLPRQPATRNITKREVVHGSGEIMVIS